MTTHSITVKSILSRPLNEIIGVQNLEQYDGLERRQNGLERTHVLSNSIDFPYTRPLPGPPHPPIMMMHRYSMGGTNGIIKLASGPGGKRNTVCLPGPPHPPIMTMHRYSMGETDGIIRLTSGPRGRCNAVCHLELSTNDVNTVTSGFVVPNILQILKRVYGEDLVRKEYNHVGAEALSGPSHPQKDTIWAYGTVSTINKVGQNTSPNRKEKVQYERDHSVNSVLAEPPHPPKKTNSNNDENDLPNNPDLETSECQSVTIPSNAEGVLNTKVSGLKITSGSTQNPLQSGTRPEGRICKNLQVIHTNVNGCTTRNVNHELRCTVLGSYDADLICVNETHLKPGKEISMPGYKFINHPCYQSELPGYKGHGGVGILVKNDLYNRYKLSAVYKDYEGILGLRLVHREHGRITHLYSTRKLEIWERIQ